MCQNGSFQGFILIKIHKLLRLYINFIPPLSKFHFIFKFWFDHDPPSPIWTISSNNLFIKNKKRNNGSYQICSTSFSGTAGPFICICRYAVYMQSFYSLYAVYCLFYKSTVINECVKCKIV